ncbi:MAG: hypothetical protein KDA22_16790 [Phycisphaerales bacterium]|nr:hypothetical protein [Phycisphaerales bacterium]
MTVVNQTRPHAPQVAAPLRLAVSWTVSVSPTSLAEHSTVDSLAEGQLVFEAVESEDGAWRASSRLEFVDRSTTLLDGLIVAGRLTDLGSAVQLDLHAAIEPPAEPLFSVLVKGDRTVYVRSSLPAIAGLGGGTYDPPVGTLRPTGDP